MVPIDHKDENPNRWFEFKNDLQDYDSFRRSLFAFDWLVYLGATFNE